jgi:hypothetical protein
MNKPTMLLAANRSEHTHSLCIDLKGQLLFRFGLINGRVCGAVDKKVGVLGRKELTHQLEMMDGQVFSGQKQKIELRPRLL